MADAWEIITAHATDTSDAWTALNSQQTTGGTPGAAVDELVFALSDPIQITATLAVPNVSAVMAVSSVAATISVPNITQSVGPDSITVLEGC